MKASVLLILLLGCVPHTAGAAWLHAAPSNPASPKTYYVDSSRGNDANSGVSPRSPWKTLARAQETPFVPGDRLLFAGGQVFPGSLKLDKGVSGEKGKPLLLSSYGKGRAILDGGAENGIVLTDCSYVIIKNLNVVGCGRKKGSDGTGIHLMRTHNVELTNVEVSGFRLAGVLTNGDENSRLTHIYAHDNGAAGIMTDSGYDNLPRSRNLYIGDCIAENNPGDPKNLTNHSGNGIVVGGVDGALIEYCEAMNNGWDMPREGNGPVGIWGWNCDRLTIQHCISHDNKSPGADGGGFDFDGGITNSILQYNLAYNNQGCGYLLCQYGGASLWKHNIMRYNISVNDGSKNFQAGIGLWLGDKGISDALIHNNTIINPVHAVATLGDLPRFIYRNNLFLVGGDILDGSFTLSRFENNLFWSTGKGVVYRDDKTVYITLAQWAEATGQECIDGTVAGKSIDPQVVQPENGQKLPTNPRKLKNMSFYHLRPGSPGVGTGMIIPNSGGRDFFGNRVPVDQRPSLGAHEPSEETKGR